MYVRINTCECMGIYECVLESKRNIWRKWDGYFWENVMGEGCDGRRVFGASVMREGS